MRSKARNTSLSRIHKDSADERKEARTTPGEARNQSVGETRRVSRDAPKHERRSARASSRRHPSSSDSEFELPI